MMIPKKSIKWIVGFNLFNVVDIILTLVGVYMFGAVELNPVMAPLVHGHPVLFALVKLLVGAGCTLLLIRKKAFGIFILSTWLYVAVAAWNISQYYFKTHPEVLQKVMELL
jgi:hypothetical protein